ncbi:helix-turn-helix domain-containing protein [Bosea sp. 2KB_26]|uniref:AraC-like ligand-binding domain-containing protein n=1 Tax=Bosea sp. 2KB_26 TaxID=3237475 RepID=UPI003F8E0B10
MKLVFSTADVPRRDRFDYWHSVACQNVTHHDSRPRCRPEFHAELRSGALADLGFVEFSNAAMAVVHSAAHAANANSDEILICRQAAGRLVLEQEGRDALLDPGDMTLLDPCLPYTGTFSADSRLLVVKAPRRQLEARIGPLRAVAARTLRPVEAEIGLTSAFLATLPTFLDRLSPVAEETVRSQTLDLIALSLGKAGGEQAQRSSSARSLVRLKVRAAIEARLHEPQIDLGSVAAAAGVSLRYANAALADENTSISRVVQERRLARCRKALEDPAQSHRTVSDIAYSWGFSDMTHFGRKFRATFGRLPSEYRRSLSEARQSKTTDIT